MPQFYRDIIDENPKPNKKRPRKSNNSSYTDNRITIGIQEIKRFSHFSQHYAGLGVLEPLGWEMERAGSIKRVGDNGAARVEISKAAPTEK